MASLDDIEEPGLLTRRQQLLIGLVVFGTGSIFASLGLMNFITHSIGPGSIGLESGLALGFGLAGSVFGISLAGMAYYVSENRTLQRGALLGAGLIILSGVSVAWSGSPPVQFQTHLVELAMFGVGASLVVTAFVWAGYQRLVSFTTLPTKLSQGYYNPKRSKPPMPADGKGEDDEEEIKPLLEDEEGE